MWPKHFLLLALVPTFVDSLAATDEIQDTDPAQSGYMDNHNMHPATVGSSIFGVLWKNFYGNNKEKWYAKPLVYTPPGQSQLCLPRIFDEHHSNSRCCQWNSFESTNCPATFSSERHWLHRHSRLYWHHCESSKAIKMGTRWMLISAQGTPIIDPSTNTVFFFSKGYKNGASNGGVANGECLRNNGT
jgi:iron transport multicopper oxidase